MRMLIVTMSYFPVVVKLQYGISKYLPIPRAKLQFIPSRNLTSKVHHFCHQHICHFFYSLKQIQHFLLGSNQHQSTSSGSDQNKIGSSQCLHPIVLIFLLTKPYQTIPLCFPLQLTIRSKCKED